ncbi:D-2-hydroxyacid dehydrogenase [Azospirillaceae bacterium]
MIASPSSSTTAVLSISESLERIKSVVGPKGWIDDPADMAPYLVEWRGRFQGKSPLIVRPAQTEEVAQVVRICAAAGIPIVPQGGNTSLVGGSIPFEDGREVVLSLSRMNRIRDVDPLNFTIVVEAGCVLKTVQDAAAEVDRLFPLSLGAEGTCQIGGCLASNAGGMSTVRYGNARDLALGLEVVLPDGQVLNALRRLRKDNTGFDLKNLFIGSEGALGVITAAVLKLFPRPRQVETAYLAVRNPAAAIELLSRFRAQSGDGVSAFELMPRMGIDFALRHVEGVTDPLPQSYDWYVIVEASSGSASEGFREAFEATLDQAIQDELVLDGTMACSIKDARMFWLMREAIVEAQKYEGGSLKNDVAVPVSRVAAFIERATAAVNERIPGIRPVAFGHVGDGNIHFNLSQPVGANTAEYMARWDEIQTAVNDIVLDLDGSISAEHGIGRIKVEELARVKSEVELTLMKQIKRMIDPRNLFNPGKVISLG